MTRRLVLALAIAVGAASTVGAATATADAPSADLRTADDYIACAGFHGVAATCVREPVGPILDLLP